LTPEDIRLTPDPVPIAIGVTAPTVRISPLFEALLQSANGLLKGKNFSAAVLVAQTAIEVCTERLITKLLDRRGASFLSGWIDDSLTSYNIGSEKVRKLYQVASGDAAIAQQLFWNRLKDHEKLRNKIAHEGRFATEDEAKASLEVAWEVVGYLTSIAKQHGIDLDLG